MAEIDLTPITRLEYDIDAILNDHAVAEPITRIELILADIVAGNTTTVEPVTRIETYLAIISGADYPVPEPVTRIETFLAIIAGEDYEEPEAVTRLEGLLAEWVEKGSGIWKTVTGTLIHLTDALASPMQKCEVTLEPIQAGSGDPSPTNVRPITGWTGCEVNVTGKNVWDMNDTSKLEQVTYIASGSAFTRWGYVIELPADKYRISAWAKPNETVNMYFYGGRAKKGSPYEKTSSQNLIAGSTITPQTVNLAEDEVLVYYNGTGNATKENVAEALSKVNIQIEKGDTTTDFDQYTGDTLSVTFPDTVYGGKYDFVSGGLKPYKEYDSYNGETLTGEWMSDRDKYVAGTTPTIGAQVVDLDGYDTTVQLTPQPISTLAGENNVWSNTNGNTTIIYKAQAE